MLPLVLAYCFRAILRSQTLDLPRMFLWAWNTCWVELFNNLLSCISSDTHKWCCVNGCMRSVDCRNWIAFQGWIKFSVSVYGTFRENMSITIRMIRHFSSLGRSNLFIAEPGISSSIFWLHVLQLGYSLCSDSGLQHTRYYGALWCDRNAFYSFTDLLQIRRGLKIS